ncbi:MAG: aldose 1-epimerase family protein [Christensenellaceae bacterium]
MEELGRKELLSYTGDFSQVFGIMECVLQNGKSKGIKAYHFYNGKDLELTVLGGKCMNIPHLRYKGSNIGFLNKTGICAPEFYQENKSKGFLRNFEAGFLTTCGITYMGSACEEDDGTQLGLHGPLANTPAENLCARTYWKDDKAYLELCGTMREASLFDENLVLDRKLTVCTDSNKILIQDTVENRGFDTQPLMLLYHFNFGYPMLDECTKVRTNLDEISARDEHSAKGIGQCDEFSKPIIGFQEEVFFRTNKEKERRNGIVVIQNEKLGIGVVIRFDPTALPVLNHWKCARAGDYGLGIEPGTCNVGGRKNARKDGTLLNIEPGEIKKYELEITFMDSIEQVQKIVNAF